MGSYPEKEHASLIISLILAQILIKALNHHAKNSKTKITQWITLNNLQTQDLAIA